MTKNMLLIAVVAAGLTGCGDRHDFKPKSELGQIAAAYQVCRAGAAARAGSGVPDPALCPAYSRLLAGIPDSEIPDVGNAAENKLIAEARRQALR